MNSQKHFAKKIIALISLVMVLCLLVLAVGCNGKKDEENNQSDTSATSSEGGKYVEEIPVVQKVTMPAFKAGATSTMSKADFEKAYRAYTDYRIYQIRTSESTIKPKNGGTAYYISSFRGDNKNDGKTPDTPFKTLARLKQLDLKSGDVVYLERGSLWREELKCDIDGVSYTAYGTGNKPMLYGSPKDVADPKVWLETDEKGVYKYAFTLQQKNNDVGTLVFNNGEECAIKVVLRKENSGVYNNTTGEPFTDYHNITKNHHFYHSDDGYVYLRCNEGNPGSVFKSIEMNVRKTVISVPADDITIDNIVVKYTGVHGVGAGTVKNLTVQNCEFYWIGGSIQDDSMWGRTFATRFGNAIQIYGGCKNFKVTNNYCYQIYDTGVTVQYLGESAGDCIMDGCYVNNNVFDKCNWSFEYFLGNQEGTTRYIKNFEIKDNLMWNCGYGFCEQRPDKRNEGHINGWPGSSENHCIGNFKISGNLFAMGKYQILVSCAAVDSEAPKYDSNIYVQTSDMFLGTSKTVVKSQKFDSNVRKTIESLFEDKHAQIIFIK